MRRLLPLPALLALLALPLLGCPGDKLPAFRFSLPREGQLSLAGDVPAQLRTPPGLEKKGSLVVTLDGEDVTGLFHGKNAELPSSPGWHSLVAKLHIGGKTFTTTRRYETILVTEPGACDGLDEQDCYALNAQVAEECDIFNTVECLLPYPSSKFLVPDPTTPTGLRARIPQIGIPRVNGPIQVPASFADLLDGFSPTVQVLTHFPQGVDVAGSGLARLIPPCLGLPGEDPECTNTSGPPWVGVRTYDARSLDPDHPTVILDWEGRRVLHWTENDVAPQSSGRQSFILRPGQSLRPGGRYVVGIRRLVSPDGPLVEPSPAFAALRDGRPTDIPQLLARRKAMKKVFRKLRRAGVPREDLILAFEFTVQSDHGLTHQMLAMRDQGLDWLAAQTQPTFVVDDVNENDCSNPDERIWKVVEGRYTVPLFLEAPPTIVSVGQHTVDANDVPVQNGVWNDAPYHLSLPCLLHPDHGDPDVPVHTLLLGHGIFGTGEGMVRGIPPAAAAVMDFWRNPPAPLQPRDTREWDYVAGATDWSGWSSSDFLWVGGSIIGLFNSSLHNFPAFPDRHRQGQLNTLVLQRMMSEGLFNSHPEFQDGEGNGLLPAPAHESASEAYYYGISMGGVQGLFHAALSQDIEKFGIDVGSMNFSFLLSRSTQFNTTNPNDIDFRTLLSNIGLTDELDVLVGLTLLHELWVSADPAGYMTRVTDASNLLPGNDFPKKLYVSPAWLDYQVSNHGTEATARTLGIESGPGSLQKGLVGIPDAPPGAALDSALVMWDTGLHDILDPAVQDEFPPLAPDVVQDPNGDPHGARPFISATIQTLMTFLHPGGQIENFCDDDGLCNASQLWECEPDVDAAGNVVPDCPGP